MNAAIATTLIASSSAIITAVGTVLVSRWQEESKRRHESAQNRINLIAKVDEIVDERVSELRCDRDNLKGEVDEGWRQRKQLELEIIEMHKEIAVLQKKMEEVELHRAQAITRMRHEVGEFSRRNTELTSENAELRIKVELLTAENNGLKATINELQQQPHRSA